MKINAAKSQWINTAVCASNLSELELALGEVAGAVGDAEQSVIYADRSGDAFQRMSTRTAHADALHQAGRRAEAETRFREAERKQQEMQPGYPLLYSLQGFQYCDLLLAAPERAAWKLILSLDSQPSTINSAVSDCRSVFQRAVQTLDWWTNRSTNASLLTIALDHLTLGRAALYAAILGNAERGMRSPDLETARRELDAAVSGLRRAGQMQELPHGLLTRAWYSFAEASCFAKAMKDESAHKLGGDAQEAARLFSRAQEELDEAWEIAERGPMKLFLADIHLYRARLFFREKEYPKAWISPQTDLAAAEKLINDCGHHRRDEELADAKAAILSR
jgi:tetratricopeptide (TPR) repeat protein